MNKKFKMEKNLALFYGILLGDGCLSKSKRKDRKNCYIYTIAITCNAHNDKPFFNRIVIPLINKLIRKEIKFRERKDGSIEIKVYNKELFIYLNNLGFPIGKKGTNIITPKIFYDKRLVKYIVQGLFATDGCFALTKNPDKYYPRLVLKAIHKDLILQIYDYLQKMGLKGHFYSSKSRPDPRWKRPHKQYLFQFNGLKNLLIFKNKIDFVNPKQQNLFIKFFEYNKEYDNLVNL